MTVNQLGVHTHVLLILECFALKKQQHSTGMSERKTHAASPLFLVAVMEQHTIF